MPEYWHFFLRLAQSGSEVTIQHTIYKANENQIHVKKKCSN